MSVRNCLSGSASWSRLTSHLNTFVFFVGGFCCWFKCFWWFDVLSHFSISAWHLSLAAKNSCHVWRAFLSDVGALPSVVLGLTLECGGGKGIRTSDDVAACNCSGRGAYTMNQWWLAAHFSCCGPHGYQTGMWYLQKKSIGGREWSYSQRWTKTLVCGVLGEKEQTVDEWIPLSQPWSNSSAAKISNHVGTALSRDDGRWLSMIAMRYESIPIQMANQSLPRVACLRAVQVCLKVSRYPKAHGGNRWTTETLAALMRDVVM